MATVTTILDGEKTTFELDENGPTILDSALNLGLDAPYSCKGGVCTTCMAKVVEGTVKMDVNFALTDKEVSKGFVLCCQAHPTSEKVVVDWDI